MNAPMLDPFRAPNIADLPPRPARLTIVEEHTGEKWPSDRPIVPNRIRVNGVALWCPQEDPVVVEEFAVDGTCARPVVVRLKLQARSLAIGQEPSRVDPAAADLRARWATVELPTMLRDLAEADLPGECAFPYAIVDGHKLQLDGEALVHEVRPGDRDGYLVLVTLPLVVRSIVFDDEPTGSRPL